MAIKKVIPYTYISQSCECGIQNQCILKTSACIYDFIVVLSDLFVIAALAVVARVLIGRGYTTKL